MSNDDLPEIPDPLYDLPANKPAAATSPAAPPAPVPAAESALAIDVPDMAEMTPPPVKVDPNKDMFTSAVQMAFLPAYSPDLNPVEFLWAWLKRHALANFCPANLGELNATARNKLKSAQHRPSIIDACWVQAGLW